MQRIRTAETQPSMQNDEQMVLQGLLAYIQMLSPSPSKHHLGSPVPPPHKAHHSEYPPSHPQLITVPSMLNIL